MSGCLPRSEVALSGMKATKRSPIWLQARAKAMLVDPLEASATVFPVLS